MWLLPRGVKMSRAIMSRPKIPVCVQSCARAGTLFGQLYKPTQPSIPLESINEDELWLGRQWQVWSIPFVDIRVVVQVKL